MKGPAKLGGGSGGGVPTGDVQSGGEAYLGEACLLSFPLGRTLSPDGQGTTRSLAGAKPGLGRPWHFVAAETAGMCRENVSCPSAPGMDHALAAAGRTWDVLNGMSDWPNIAGMPNIFGDGAEWLVNPVDAPPDAYGASLGSHAAALYVGLCSILY